FPVLQVLIDVDVAESVAALKELLPRETKTVRNPGESLPRLEPIRVDQVRSGDDVPYRPFVVNDFRRGDLPAFGRIRMNRSGFLLPESLDVDGPIKGHVVEAGAKGIPCPGLLDEEFCPVSEVFLEGFVRRVLDLHFDGVLHPHEAPHQPGDDVVDSDPDDRNDDVRGPGPGEGLLLVLRLRTVGSRQTGELLLPPLVNFESRSKLAVDVLDQLRLLLFGQFNVDRFELSHGGRLLPGSEDTGLQYQVSAARCSESVPPTPASRFSYGLSRPHAWHGHAPHRHLSLSASLLAQSSRHDSSSSSVPRNATARGETTFFVSHGTANPIHVSPFFCFYKAEERQASCCRGEEVHRSSDWKGLEFVDEVLDARSSLSKVYHVRLDVGSESPNACVLRSDWSLFRDGEGVVHFPHRVEQRELQRPLESDVFNRSLVKFVALVERNELREEKGRVLALRIRLGNEEAALLVLEHHDHRVPSVLLLLGFAHRRVPEADTTETGERNDFVRAVRMLKDEVAFVVENEPAEVVLVELRKLRILRVVQVQHRVHERPLLLPDALAGGCGKQFLEEVVRLPVLRGELVRVHIPDGRIATSLCFFEIRLELGTRPVQRPHQELIRVAFVLLDVRVDVIMSPSRADEEIVRLLLVDEKAFRGPVEVLYPLSDRRGFVRRLVFEVVLDLNGVVAGDEV